MNSIVDLPADGQLASSHFISRIIPKMRQRSATCEKKKLASRSDTLLSELRTTRERKKLTALYPPFTLSRPSRITGTSPKSTVSIGAARQQEGRASQATPLSTSETLAMMPSRANNE